ncbi:MAG: ATP-binding protein [Chthoniobacteraceae bacterium]|jgi:DNA polymerase III delta prime subunit
MKATFSETLPEGAELLHRAKVSRTPPCPEQTAFVQQWPFSEIRELIFDKTGIKLHPPGLYLYGPTGSGKSTAVYSVIKECWGKFPARDYDTPGVINLSGGQLATRLVDACLGRSEDFDTIGEMIDVLGGCKLFFLDELDKMNQTPAVLRHFAEIIRRRHLKPFTYLFTTTNSTPTGMLEKADKETRNPMRRRIIEMTVAVNFGDPKFQCSKHLGLLETMYLDRAEREAIAREEEQAEELRETERLAQEKAERDEQERIECEARKAIEDEDATIRAALYAGTANQLPESLRAKADAMREQATPLRRSLWLSIAGAAARRANQMAAPTEAADTPTE